ncbi:MAG TPA: hypothetical protein EYP10_05985, partial [Armatimonadetes bacterium]|nr:hypothetical protein [Armatimonadota bacterium]
MSIELYQVKGDIMELVFDPREDDLRVGETLCVRERDSQNGLIVQVIAFRTVTYPSLVRELLRLAVNGGYADNDGNDGNDGSRMPAESVLDANGGETAPELLDMLSESLTSELSQERNLKLAICKIRKLV